MASARIRYASRPWVSDATSAPVHTPLDGAVTVWYNESWAFEPTGGDGAAREEDEMTRGEFIDAAEIAAAGVPGVTIAPREANCGVPQFAVPDAVALDRLMESIRRLVHAGPVTMTSEGNVIDGQTRVEAARQLGLETVPALAMNSAGCWEPCFLTL